ncbi:hypothetical protein IFR05_013430 [Cadophora sp. M221]|nr:hypothetical protein IFR05_013430 [Cadophora sp. M221]
MLHRDCCSAIAGEMQDECATAVASGAQGGRRQGIRASVRRTRIGANELAGFRFDFAAHSMPCDKDTQGYHVRVQTDSLLKSRCSVLETRQSSLSAAAAAAAVFLLP